MGILFFYQMRQLLVPIAVAVAGLILLMLSGTLLEVGNSIMVKKIPADIVLSMLLYKTPVLFVSTLPVAVLFATMFTLGRLAKDSEIIIMRIAGFSCRRIILPYLLVALMVSGAAYLINEYVSPWSNHEGEVLMRRILFESPPPEMAENVVFRDKDRFVYISRVDPRSSSLYNVIVYEVHDGQIARAILAKEGRYAANIWILSNGVMHEFAPDGLISREMSFGEFKLNVEMDNLSMFRQQRSAAEMSRLELADLIAFLRERSVDTAAFEVDYHLKTALPLATFAFVLLGIPFMINAQSHQRFYGIIISIIIALFYFVAISFFSAAGRTKVLPPFWAAWLPNVLALTAGIAFTLWADRRKGRIW